VRSQRDAGPDVCGFVLAGPVVADPGPAWPPVPLPASRRRALRRRRQPGSG